MSGFLITGILLDSLQRRYFFKRFYWRRGLRIWPLYYAFLVGALIVHRQVFHGIGFAPFALYYRNFLGPDRASDIYIGQFWSLCVEEQFYLIWPVVICFTPRRLLLPLIVFLMSVALFLRIYLSSHGMSGYVVYRLPFCHMDVLLAGAAVAVLSRDRIRDELLRGICAIGVWSGFLGLVLLMTMQPTKDAIVFGSLGLTCTSLLFGGLVGLSLKSGRGHASAVLGSQFLRAISTRSYAMYVFHLVPLYLSFRILSKLKAMPSGVFAGLAMTFGIALVTYGMAWISWRVFEEPILRLKKWEWFAKAPIELVGSTSRSD